DRDLAAQAGPDLCPEREITEPAAHARNPSCPTRVASAALSSTDLRPSRSTPPGRTEQESDPHREGERGVGAVLERLVDGIDHVVADLAYGIDGFLALGADIRDHTFHVRLCAAPGGVASGGENVGDLVGEAGDIVSRGLHSCLYIITRGSRSAATFAGRFLGLSHSIPNRISDRAGCVGHERAPL